MGDIKEYGGSSAVSVSLIATDAEIAKIPKSDAAVSFNTTALQAMQDEAEDALEGENLDHLLQLDGATSKYPEQCAADSIMAKIIAKGDPATPSTFDCTTDSLEMLSDKIGAFSGDGGAAADDSIKAILDLMIADTQIRVAASGAKTIGSAGTKWLSLDSGTNGAEILGIVSNVVVGDIWTLDIYVPSADAVADTAAADLRDSISYAASDTKGGLIAPFAIPFNCFLDFTNGGVDEDSITQVQVIYRSRAALTLAWEA